MICEIAGFVVEFKNASNNVVKLFKSYLSHGIPQVSFEITQQEIQKEIDLVNGQCTVVNAELTAMLRKLYRWILAYDSFILHSVLVDVDGVGVTFAAPSGTGKTTHMRLWQNLLGDRLTIVNGDKPIVRFFDDNQPIGFGTPWCGKERYEINTKTTIKHFCIIERSDFNSCEQIDPKDILNFIFKQVILPINNPAAVSKTLNLLNRFLTNVTVWKIKCNMDITAAQVAYDAIFKENNNEA